MRATSLTEAVAALHERPGAVLLAGGTEVVPAGGADHLVSLRRVPGLRGVLSADGDEVVLGALTTYADLALGVGGVEVLTAMAPTVGSPASRNAGTLGGALGTGSGAGDAVTALLALDALVEVARRHGTVRVPVQAWLDRSGRLPGDVVRAVAVPRLPGHYLKAGERQAVFYATASVALVVDGARQQLRCALGSVADLPVRATVAEALPLRWRDGRPVATPQVCLAFGAAAAAGLAPAAGLRVTGAHRRHVVGVLAARALARAGA